MTTNTQAFKTVKITDDVHLQLKLLSVEIGKTMSDTIAFLLGKDK